MTDIFNDPGSPFRFAAFKQTLSDPHIEELQSRFSLPEFCDAPDSALEENRYFEYPVCFPQGRPLESGAILLLHGLNERDWSKYPHWAQALAQGTGRPVILFPIAFHINRCPSLWSNARAMMPLVKKRKISAREADNLSFVNLALSERLSQDPLRFYVAGKETAYNICQLVSEIQEGRHPFFPVRCQVNIFAYSIGALLSQVLLLANPHRLFDRTKLFLFCGGSVFNRMNGNSRFIMDSMAYARILDYYQNQFLLQSPDWKDQIDMAFKAMIDAAFLRQWRESFFLSATGRIRVVSLKKDSVIPTAGIREALGDACAETCLAEWDFPFHYSHETPFPNNEAEHSTAFGSLFSLAAAWLR